MKSRFAPKAWALLGYNLLVIAWGAYVRASGSGAGCGAHWPLCNGEIVPRSPGVEMLVELSHRVTSGLSLLFGVGLTVLAFRLYPRGHRVRRGAAFSLGFVFAEALIGAGLVLFELVAHDASSKRALSMALHLTNTFFLLGALTLTAHFASNEPDETKDGPPTVFSRLRKQGALSWLLAAALGGVVVVGMSGAVTALGDTLFPAQSLAEGLAQEWSPTAHLFVRLRVLHPVLAAFVSVLVLAAATTARLLRPSDRVRRFSYAASALVMLQILAGLLNVALLAPIPMQLLHLLLADAVWIVLVLLAVEAHEPIISRNGAAPSNDVPPSTSSVAPVT